jgi:SLOG cluster2
MSEKARFNELELPLWGLRVGLSGAVPEREHWGAVADLDRQILRFVSQFSNLVMAYGGEIVHGSHPTFAPVVAEAARRNGLKTFGNETDQRPISQLTLVASQLWGEQPEVAFRASRIAQAPVILTPKIGQGDIKDTTTRNDSLTAMRLALCEEIDVLVAIGGKLHQSTQFNAGVLEELVQARWNKASCFIVACGGMTSQLDPELLRLFCADNLLGDQNQSFALEMATWSENTEAYVGKLLVHLARHRDAFLRRRIHSTNNLEYPINLGIQELSARGNLSEFFSPEFPENSVPSKSRPVILNTRVDVKRVKRAASGFAYLFEALKKNDFSVVENVLTSEAP